MKKVLIVEDDIDIVNLLKLHLEDLDCEISTAQTGTEGMESINSNSFDLIILDLMLPGVDGLEICRQVRANKNYTPILMLTAKAEEIDRVLGLESGADDYLTKPFSVREFISRIKAIFRRVEMITSTLKQEVESTINYKELEIDPLKRKVTKNNVRLSLTPKEFDLLLLMAKNPGRSYTREQLLKLVWRYEFSGYDHTVNSHVSRLRAKIESDINKPEYILTNWGVGYMFNDEIA
jgi:DNA-binding response OmpR family regulator